jgi:hypothetical protein
MLVGDTEGLAAGAPKHGKAASKADTSHSRGLDAGLSITHVRSVLVHDGCPRKYVARSGHETACLRGRLKISDQWLIGRTKLLKYGEPGARPSVVDLIFDSALPRPQIECQIQNHVRIQYLPVSFRF